MDNVASTRDGLNRSGHSSVPRTLPNPASWANRSGLYRTEWHATRTAARDAAVLVGRSYRDLIAAHPFHAGAKSLGPDGVPCHQRSVGLLGRRPVELDPAAPRRCAPLAPGLILKGPAATPTPCPREPPCTTDTPMHGLSPRARARVEFSDTANRPWDSLGPASWRVDCRWARLPTADS